MVDGCASMYEDDYLDVLHHYVVFLYQLAQAHPHHVLHFLVVSYHRYLTWQNLLLCWFNFIFSFRCLVATHCKETLS